MPSAPPTLTSPDAPPPPSSFNLHTNRILHIGTRSSALALAQTQLFVALLSDSSSSSTFLSNPPQPPIQIHPTTTTGDQNLTTSLSNLADITGKSLWTHELEASLLAGDIDCIVHSLKDVPTKLRDGCVVQAVGEREHPGDVFVVRAGRPDDVGSLQALLDTGGGTVGTSSVRRAAMIRRGYPGLKIKDVRGNVGTRLRKLDSVEEGYDALILAGAGVLRLGLGERIVSWVGRAEGMMHAVGQGALGVEYREGDIWVESLLSEILRKGSIGGDGVGRRVGWECAAERRMLGVLEGGCSVPVGVETEWEDPPKAGGVEDPYRIASASDQADCGTLTMRAMVLSVDGSECVEGERRQKVSSTAEAEECGFQLARDLINKGAGKILEKITADRGHAIAQAQVQEQGRAD